jgi:hypothetical protein
MGRNLGETLTLFNAAVDLVGLAPRNDNKRLNGPAVMYLAAKVEGCTLESELWTHRAYVKLVFSCASPGRPNECATPAPFVGVRPT